MVPIGRNGVDNFEVVDLVLSQENPYIFVGVSELVHEGVVEPLEHSEVQYE